MENSTLYYNQTGINFLIDSIDETSNTVWVVIATAMILMMQVGFALLEAGSVSQKNSSNILIKNIIDTFTAILAFYLIGYGLANDLKGGILGVGKFCGMNFTSEDYLKWIFQFAFCTTSTTIVSGSLAERTFVDTYLIYSMIMTGIIYPIAAGWAWGGGWL